MNIKCLGSLLMAILLFLLIKPSEAFALEKVRFTPAWTPQAQFAGYYVAFEKGFFREQGLDVKIIHVKQSSMVSSTEMLETGETDIISTTLFRALKTMGDGTKLVNFLQVSQHSGLMCAANFPIKYLEDLDNKRVNTWKTGYKEIADMAVFDKNIKINWIPSIGKQNLFINRAVDATLCFSYNEYFELLFARGQIPEENVIRFSQIGYDFPEDGLYTKQVFFEKNEQLLGPFAVAVTQGWQYCRDNPEEALDIVVKYMNDNHIICNRYHQKLMLQEILRLQVDENGKASYCPITKEVFNRIVNKMKSIGQFVGDVKYEEMIK